MRHLIFSIAFLVGLLGASHSHAANAAKEWTFLVYLNGDNSLDSYGPMNINQMEKVGSTNKINVVVQWASIDAGGTKRLYIQQDNDTTNVTSPVIQNMGKVDMGNYQTLIDFVKWGVANYPAQHYFLNVWDHGGGWHLQSAIKRFGFDSGPIIVTPNDISWDDGSGNFITTPQLGMAVNAAAGIMGHKVDIYGSDACLMAMPEVAAEMASSVDVYLGSEEVEPAAGWPYDNFLAKWDALSNATPAAVGKLLTDEYVASYQNGSNGTSDVTFSAFDMSQFDQVKAAVSSLGTELANLSSTDKASAIKAIANTQTFSYKDYGDLVDFTDQLGSLAKVNPATLSAVVAANNSFVIANSTTSKYKKAHGTSIWLPGNTSTFGNYWSRYSNLTFNQQTHWGDSLKTLLGAK